MTREPVGTTAGTRHASGGATAATSSGDAQTPAVVAATGGTRGSVVAGVSDAAQQADTAAGGQSCTTPFVIGASYSSDLASALATVGNPAYAAAQENYAQTVQQSYKLGADDLNQRGGLHGCSVQLVFHDFKTLGSDGRDGQSQQECTDFTQDHKVSMVYANAIEDRVLVECLHQQGVPVTMAAGAFSADQPDMEKYRGTLFQPNSLTVSRYGPFIDQFAAAGYFDPGAKVGILVGDDGSGSRIRMVNELWKPQLQARGFDPVVFQYTTAEGISDASRVATVMGQAVLQFKAAQVDHVLMPPDEAEGLVFFTQAADSQSYRPRYGITTESGAQGWYTAPADQRSRAVAISYRVDDVNTQSVLDQNPATPTRAHCQELYLAQNLPVDYPWCDFLSFLQEVFANEDPSTDAMLHDVEALGSAHQSASGYGATFFGPSRYDGLTQIRTLVWDDAASEWAYASPVVDVP